MINLNNNIIPLQSPKRKRNVNIKRLRLNFATIAKEGQKYDRLLKRAKANLCSSLKYLKMNLVGLSKEASVKYIKSVKTFNGTEYKCVATLRDFNGLELIEKIASHYGCRINSIDKTNTSVEIIINGLKHVNLEELGKKDWGDHLYGYLNVKKSDAELICKNGVDVETKPKDNRVNMIFLRNGLNPANFLDCKEDECILKMNLWRTDYCFDPSYECSFEDAIVLTTFQDIGENCFELL